jgi:hypothetical protein
MRDLWHATRNTSVEVRYLSQTNPVTRRPALAIASNAASISARMNAIRAAIDEAQRMALEPDQTDIDIRLESLRRSLPAIGGPEIPKEGRRK